MRRKDAVAHVDVVGTQLQVSDPEGKKLLAHEFCHYCGAMLEKSSSYAYHALTFVELNIYWDGCELGRIGGATEIIRQRNIATAKVFQKQYPLYEEHRPCPKCGNEHRSTEFKTGGQNWSPYGGSGSAFIHPYIERLCGRCTFHTYEVPLDFDPVVIFPKDVLNGE